MLRWLCLGVFLTSSWTADACCGVGRSAVTFLGQMNIIVWDPVEKREVFVRKASFLTNAEDFGFLAPTPAVPDIAEVDAAAFATLERLKPVEDRSWGWMVSRTASKGGVRVIKEIDAAGYHAATLRADDAKGLKNWLSENKYGTSKGIEKWLEFYVQKGWFITAFKVTRGEYSSPEGLKTGTVKMTFATDRPFNPYYVPAENFDAPVGKRSSADTQLKVFFVSDRAYRGVREDKGSWVEADWTAPVHTASRERLIGQLKLPASGFGAMNRVTTFIDPNFPQAASGDIYFEPAPDYSWIWVLGTVTVLGGGYVLWQRRRPVLNPAGIRE